MNKNALCALPMLLIRAKGRLADLIKSLWAIRYWSEVHLLELRSVWRWDQSPIPSSVGKQLHLDVRRRGKTDRGFWLGFVGVFFLRYLIHTCPRKEEQEPTCRINRQLTKWLTWHFATSIWFTQIFQLSEAGRSLIFYPLQDPWHIL